MRRRLVHKYCLTSTRATGQKTGQRGIWRVSGHFQHMPGGAETGVVRS